VGRQEDRLDRGVRNLRTTSGARRFDERTVMLAGSALAVLGLVAILVGWYGAAHSPYLFQQVPYLISGGLLGLGLVFLGATLYFAHWLTELLKEGRTQSAALLDAIARLEATVKQQQLGSGADLVATQKGTMAHRSDCVVVSGKDGLRRIKRADGLESCKLCEPYFGGASR
jgi:hypothetical protein